MATSRSSYFLQSMQQRYFAISRDFTTGPFGCANYLNKCLLQNNSSSRKNISIRRTFAYASVNHELEYKDAMEGRHGEQLQLALKEGAKYENEKVDPFELYKIVDATVQENDEILEEDIGDVNEAEDTDSDEDDEDEVDSDDEDESALTEFMYRNDGQPNRTKAELVSFKAGAPAGGKFAIVDLNGSQQKITVDDVVIVNKLKPVQKWAVGSKHTLTAEDGSVLLLGSQEKTLVGLPFVNGGEVDVMVEEITRDKTVIVFKKKRRKNYRKKNGSRREVTFLRVLDIRFP
mmetsp:Transcript_5398/g.6906  ORF Transcript_5398/g.6906 Transcript_5398/m.6906 type:complete len:289 (+) Transcript_5398:253-1119(+)